MKTKTAIACTLILAILSTLPIQAQAQEPEIEFDPELEALLKTETEVSHYQFPEIDPEYSISLGFRTMDRSGLQSPLSFGELDDSAIFDVHYRGFNFPHRFFFFFDLQGKDEYFGELRYALGDTVFVRWLGNSVYRNAESVTPIDANPGSGNYEVSINDEGVEYGMKKNTEDLFVRLKYPNYASHLFIRAWMVHEEGTMQQRTLLGSGWFNDIVRDTQDRQYKWHTYDYSVGANSHVGPIEIEVEHYDSRFSMNTDPSTTSYYTAAAPIGNPAGYYNHHLYPDSSITGNSIKVHTSYTGKLVASATYATREMTNDYSWVNADYSFGTAGLQWMPKTSLTFFLRYKRMDLAYDNNSQASAPGIKNGLSSTRDDFSLTARFRPVSSLVLRARYRSVVTRRDNAAEWDLSSAEETKNTYSISARTSQIKNFKIKAEYSYTEVDDPAYNTEPDSQSRAKATMDWKVTQKTLAFLSISAMDSERALLHFGDGITANNRTTDRNSGMIGITYMASERLSTTVTYNGFLSSIAQDMVHEDSLGLANIVAPSQYEGRISGISIDLSYMASEKLALQAGAYHTVSRGSFETSDQSLTLPVSLSTLLDKEITEAELNLSGQYSMSQNMELDAEYTYKKLSEDLINPYDALNGGEVQTVTAKVTRRW